jgi:CTP:molybdopterin cytidylyltransferase MocA
VNTETGAVIVAAGLSSRMGAYKPLMEIGGVSVARRVTGAFTGAGVSPIVVVTGYRADELEAHLSANGADAADEPPIRPLPRAAGRAEDHDVPQPAYTDADTMDNVIVTARGDIDEKRVELLFVRNENYATTSMYESAKIGLSYLLGRCNRAFFCPVDVPLFTADTVRRLMRSGAPIVKPVYEGKEGHPILIGAELIPALIGLGRACGADPKTEKQEPTGGLNEALARFANVTERIEVDDEGILHDADTPEDMAALLNLLKKNPKTT